MPVFYETHTPAKTAHGVWIPVGEARGRWSNVFVALVAARPGTLAARLAERGREPDGDRRSRGSATACSDATPPAAKPYGFRALSGYTPEAWRKLIAKPRRHGFHATIKAPFRLAEERALAELEPAVAALAASLIAFDVGPLSVTLVSFAGGAFVALQRSETRPGLWDLEALVMRGLDAFRAQPTATELARRRPERVGARQRENLAAWGYPYVLEEF